MTFWFGSLGLCLVLLWPSFSISEGKALPQRDRSILRYYSVDAIPLSSKDLHCLALNIYHEARGEPFAGRVGVAQVTLNRVQVKHRGVRTVCQAVYAHKQFSWTTKPGKSRHPQGSAWQDSLYVAQQVAQGLRIDALWDALYFHHRHERVYWTRTLRMQLAIGNHVYWSIPV